MRSARRILLAAALTLSAIAALPAFATAADEFDKYALESVSASLSSPQAGAHADFTTKFVLTRKEGEPYAKTRDVELRLAPGLIGNPQAIPSCTIGQLGNDLEESGCPASSQVGVTEIKVIEPISGIYTEPIYNMEPPGGDIVARFGFFAALWPAFINVRVDPTDYSIVATLEGAPSAAGLLEASTTIWGVPADPVHDALRLTPSEAFGGKFPPGGRPAGIPPAPFLSNPTECAMQREVEITARSYQLPNQPSTLSAPLPPIIGCGKLEFTPSFGLIATNPEAFAPTGIDSELLIPQDETADGRATSTMKSATVTLPEGIAINPAAADGLEACSAEQVDYGENVASNCPDAAKIGSLEVEVPALEDTLDGSVYQRTPEPGRLFGIWLVTDEQGVHLKLPGRIEADPATGQLKTVFDGIDSLGGLPQVPFEELALQIFGGPRAPLSAPACGTYQTSFSFTPWSGKAPVQGKTPLAISFGCGKGGFAPGLKAGSTRSAAGEYAPFALTLTRSDGEANPQTLSVHLPQGLLAKLAGVPLCPEAATASGACPSDSRIGSLAAATGVGGNPLWIPQPGKSPTAVYLAGPYKGAPYSLVAVVPAQAGPFDLGTVVVRSAIHVDPSSAEATIVTDPLPQILQGVPVTYRTIHAFVDRPEFTLNPTGCALKKISATLTASNGLAAEPSDDFQATNCAKLGFKPRLSLALRGGTERGDYPALRSVYRPRGGDANLKRLLLRLPPSAFLAQEHIRTICTRVQFAAGEGNGSQCPKASVYGHVRAITPLLDQPLEGPVYLRSSNHNLPDLVLSLKGAIEIEAAARIDSKDGGIRATFANLPDAPLTKVVVNMQGGKKGLIVNSRDLCAAKSRALAELGAHNGRSRAARPLVRADCKRK